MYKIGIVGGAKFWHARTFCEMFNGYDRKLAKVNNYPLYEARIKDAKVTHIWDKDRKEAELLAKVCEIENVVDKKEDIIEKVDGVIIADDCTMKHQRKATPFLKAGLSTFIDKPLSPDIKEAEDIINLAQKYKAPLMSCSAVRYSKEIEEYKKEKNKIGDILTGFALGRGDLIFYGIHPLEGLYSILGPGIKSVRNLGSKDKDIVLIRYKDGRDFILQVYKELNCPFQINLYGEKDYRQIPIEDSDYYYSNMLKFFVQMVRTEKEPFSPEETLEIIKVLILSEKSRKGNIELKIL